MLIAVFSSTKMVTPDNERLILYYIILYYIILYYIILYYIILYYIILYYIILYYIILYYIILFHLLYRVLEQRFSPRRSVKENVPRYLQFKHFNRTLGRKFTYSNVNRGQWIVIFLVNRPMTLKHPDKKIK